MEMNSFIPSNILGQKISGTNVLSVEFYAASGSGVTAVTPGVAVKAVSTAIGLVTKVALLSAASDATLGVVLSKPMKSSFAVGEVIEIGMENTILPMTAGESITAGQELEFDPSDDKVYVKNTGAKMGVALTDADEDDLVRVYIQH